MTPQEAAALLLDEFQLDAIEEIVRDDAKADLSHDGLSGNHPRVLMFREVCATLRRFAEGGIPV